MQGGDLLGHRGLKLGHGGLVFLTCDRRGTLRRALSLSWTRVWTAWYCIVTPNSVSIHCCTAPYEAKPSGRARASVRRARCCEVRAGRLPGKGLTANMASSPPAAYVSSHSPTLLR